MTDPLLDFSDKVVLITGAASGFGKLLAKSFSERGAKLVLGDINEEGVNEVAGELLGDAVAMGCDVADESHCQAMVDAAVEVYGGLDIAINNAGIAHETMPLDQLTDEILDRQWAVNLKGVLYGIKHQVNAMQARGGGAILNVSSKAGIGAAPGIGAYAAAKHGVIGLTKTAAAEYGRYNIRVNAVCPYFTPTPMVIESKHIESFDKFTQRVSRTVPLKRLSTPEETADLMLLLCSPGNSFMSGQTVAVDGGMSAL